jgi:hypothetical protein
MRKNPHYHRASPRGEAIYARVNTLRKDLGLTPTEAFKIVAAEEGGREGNIASNYYRMSAKYKDKRKKQPVGPLQAQGMVATQGEVVQIVDHPRPLRAVPNQLDTLLGNLHSAVSALGAYMTDMETELATAREQLATIDKIRQILA